MKHTGRFTNILVGTDFSALSSNALDVAISLCKRHGAKLHIVHAPEPYKMAIPPKIELPAFYISPELEKSAASVLDSLARKIAKEHKIKVTGYTKTGNPSDVLIEMAMKHACEIIVLGTHGISGFREFFMGNTAYSVIRNTIIPVLTIPGHRRVTQFRKVLFPIRAASGIMEKFDYMLPVIDTWKSKLRIAGLSLKSEILNLDDRKKELLQLGKSLERHGIAFQSEFHICKNYSRTVLKLAEKYKIDLIVINATLDYSWSDYFVGPYTQQMINHAKIPVLSVRPQSYALCQKKAVHKKNTQVVKG